MEAKKFELFFVLLYVDQPHSLICICSYIMIMSIFTICETLIEHHHELKNIETSFWEPKHDHKLENTKSRKR
jgi:hypothetical protein